MRFSQPLTRARLERRYKRFLAEVRLEDGRVATVHVPNPGAMLGLSDDGAAVWLSHSTAISRKLALTLELVEAAGGLVGVNTLLPNRLVAEALAADAIEPLARRGAARREVAYAGSSRADFLMTGQDGARTWLEVKSVTLSRTKGLAEWPDCVSARSTKHLAALSTMVAAGDRATLLFVVQRSDCEAVAIAGDLDPVFASALDAARARGVEVLAYDCDVSPAEIAIRRRLPFDARRALTSAPAP